MFLVDEGVGAVGLVGDVLHDLRVVVVAETEGVHREIMANGNLSCLLDDLV